MSDLTKSIELNPHDRRLWDQEREAAFESGTVETATPEQLSRWLILACTGTIPNQYVHPREILRGITINHIQTGRVIAKLETTIAALNSQNDKVAKRVLWLTLICAGGTVAQVIIALCR